MVGLSAVGLLFGEGEADLLGDGDADLLGDGDADLLDEGDADLLDEGDADLFGDGEAVFSVVTETLGASAFGDAAGVEDASTSWDTANRVATTKRAVTAMRVIFIVFFCGIVSTALRGRGKRQRREPYFGAQDSVKAHSCRKSCWPRSCYTP